MQRLMLSEIAAACEGRLRGDDVPVSGVVIDSRKAYTGALFVALKGERSDGHDFIDKAFEAGAAAALCSRDPENGGRCVLVRDTLAAYQALSGWYRSRFDVNVLAVTGSVGKTTTKEFCHAVLSARYNTLKTEGNLNSDTGLPLMLFSLMPVHKAAVFEMGMSNAGEIGLLSRLARPRAAVITNIGTSHIESLKSRDNILRAKLEVQEGMPPDGVLVLNGDDDMLRSAAGIIRRPALWYGFGQGCDFAAEDVSEDGDGTSFLVRCPSGVYPARISAVGRHNVLNALAAVAAGFVMGVEPKHGAAALGDYAGLAMRQQIYLCGPVRIIEDCYNASPDSMRAALSVLARHTAGRRIALLGDMLELGEHAEALHREVGRAAAESVDALVAYGTHSAALCDEAIRAGLDASRVFYEEKESAAERLASLVKPGDTVLFKASRGMRAEDVLQEFRAAIT